MRTTKTAFRIQPFIRKVRGVCFCFALLLAWPLAVFAQSDSRSVIKPQAYVSATGVRAGDKFKIAVALQVDKGFHINSHSASQEDLIQTEIQFTPPPGILIVDTKYPPGSLQTFAFSPDSWPVWWPDGKRIAYLTIGPDWNQQVRIVPLDGGPSTAITDLHFAGTNFPIDTYGKSQIAATNSVHLSTEVWIATQER